MLSTTTHIPGFMVRSFWTECCDHECNYHNMYAGDNPVVGMSSHNLERSSLPYCDDIHNMQVNLMHSGSQPLIRCTCLLGEYQHVTIPFAEWDQSKSVYYISLCGLIPPHMCETSKVQVVKLGLISWLIRMEINYAVHLYALYMYYTVQDTINMLVFIGPDIRCIECAQVHFLLHGNEEHMSM